MPEAEWWRSVFDEKYIRTYVDIVTDELTARQIDFIEERLDLSRGARILDLACGYGRHAIALAKRGYAVTGLDASTHFLALARSEAKAAGGRVSFVKGDMRRFAFDQPFDAVINMFTSFGFFEKEEDHRRVIAACAAALKPRGRLLIDLNNGVGTIARIGQNGTMDAKTGRLTMSRSNRLSNGLTVETNHEFDVAAMRWFMTRRWRERGQRKSYRTSVRMFSLPELTHLLEERGLRVASAFGDFDGAEFRFGSPRMIVIARKAGRRVSA